MFHLPRLAVISLGSLLLAGGVQSQTPPAQSPPPAAAKMPAAPGIDPQAKALLYQVITAHKKLMSLSETLSVETDEGGGTPETQTVTMAFQHLGFQRLAKVAVAGKDGPIQQIVTDGKQIVTLSAPDKKYAVEAVPADAFIVSTVLGRAGALIPTVIGHPEALVEILSAATAAALGPSGVIGGVPVDTIILTLPNNTGPSSHVVLAFGHDDHLLRRFVQTVPETRGFVTVTLLHSETVSALSVNPPLTAADFVFVPPPGAKKVAALSLSAPSF